jgi:hypothetical protein
MKYDQVKDGDWVRPKRKGYKMMCCDCGLIHKINFRTTRGYIEFQATRDRGATASARRGKRRFQIKYLDK